MKLGNLNRIIAESGDEGTFSALLVAALSIYLGELPPRADAHNLSCLPPMLGEAPVTYLLQYVLSEAHGKSNYRFMGVINADGSVSPMPNGRNDAEIHSGNLMGDILKGWAAQVEGCGCPGRAIVTFAAGSPFKSFTKASPTQLVPITLAQAQKGVSSSVDALAAFEVEMAGEDLALTVQWI